MLSLLLFAKPIINVATGSGLTERFPTHFDYRAKIFSKGLKDVVQNTDFGETEKIHLLRAAHNKWFIQNYYWLKDDQSLLTNYFKLQPHSNRGVPFLTQTSDLVALRYVISEHSEIFVLLYILFGILTFWILLNYLNFKNPFHIALMSIWYFIVIRSIFVWMTVTNKIVFFGQDFPFFSINARLIFWFTLFLLGLLPLFFAEGDNSKPLDDQNEDNSKLVGKLRQLPIYLFVLVVFLYGTDQVFQWFNDKEEAKQSFNIAPNLQDVKNVLVDVNAEFSTYQKNRYPEGLGNDLTPTELVVEFYAAMKRVADSKVNQAIKENDENIFATSVVRNFFDSSGDKTSLNNLIYTYRANNGEYRFKLRSDFFTIPSIQSKKNNWKGSVLSAPVFGEYSLILNDSIYSKEINWKNVLRLNLSSEATALSNVRAASYPETWTSTGKPLLFFWSEGKGATSDFSISNGIFAYSSSKDDMMSGTGIKYPLAMSPLDYINTTERRLDETGRIELINTRYEIVADKDQYLAKNIWMNGKKNKFLYPLNYKFIWPYHVAEMGKARLSDSLELENTHIETTIDYGLQDEIFNIVASHNQPHNFSLVTMDGDAKIRDVI